MTSPRRGRRAEARGLVDRYADEHARPVPERAAVRKEIDEDLDEDAEWARIVAAFEAENGRLAGPADVTASDAPPPAPREPSILDLPDEHFQPPPAPPLPVPAPSSLYAVLLVAGGILLIGVPSLIGLSQDLGLLFGVLLIGAGAALLVSRMRERATDEGDDGAVV